MVTRIVCASLMILPFLVACGQRGALYMPQAQLGAESAQQPTDGALDRQEPHDEVESDQKPKNEGVR